MTRNNRSAIPVCRSKFLEDLTIAIGGRSLKSLRKSNPTLIFDVTEDDVNGSAIERLGIEARTLSDRLTKIAVWEDGVAWIYSRERARKNLIRPILDLHANLGGMDIEDVAELLRTGLAEPASVEKEWKIHAISGNREINNQERLE